MKIRWTDFYDFYRFIYDIEIIEFQIGHVSAKVLHFPKEWTLFATSDCGNDSCISEQDTWRNCYCHHFQCSQSLWFVSLTKISKKIKIVINMKKAHILKRILSWDILRLNKCFKQSLCPFTIHYSALTYFRK